MPLLFNFFRQLQSVRHQFRFFTPSLRSATCLGSAACSLNNMILDGHTKKGRKEERKVSAAD